MMFEKLVLVNPFLGFSHKLFPPINLAQLAAFIRQNNKIDVSIVDLNVNLRNCKSNRLIERSIKIVKKQDPDIIGMTCNSVDLPFCIKFTKNYKNIYPHTSIVLGGLYATSKPNKTFQLCNIDCIVRGEGEISLLKLLHGVKKERIYGISFKKGKRIIHNKDRPLIQDLSILPLPAYDLLSMEKYKEGMVIGSRGCGYKCIFCSSRKIWKYQRRRPVKHIIKEIEILKEKYHMNRINFGDDCFTLNKKWVEDLLSKMVHMGIEWSCLTRIDCIDDDLLEKMAQSGCREIYHGIESGSEKIRNILKKNFKSHITNKNIISTIKKEVQLKIKPKCSFLVCIPHENKNDIEHTINLAYYLKTVGAKIQLWIMTPYPDIDAISLYKEKMIKFNKWKTIGQSDVFKEEQYFFYGDILNEIITENPDQLIFAPDIKLDEFLDIYRNVKKILFGIPEIEEGIICNKFKPTKFIEKFKSYDLTYTNGISNFYGNPFLELIVPKANLEKISKKIIKIKPEITLISFNFDMKHLNEKIGTRIVKFLNLLKLNDIKFKIIKPMPVCLFPKDYEKMNNEFNIPTSCIECLNIYKIEENESIILCKVISKKMEERGPPIENISSDIINKNRMYKYFNKFFDRIEKNYPTQCNLCHFRVLRKCHYANCMIRIK